MTAWIVVTVVSKSATSWEIATFITAWSRTIRNCAAPRTARTPHLAMTHPKRRRPSSAEDLGLLGRELLLGQNPLLFQLPQLFELVDSRIRARGCLRLGSPHRLRGLFLGFLF